MYFAGKQCSHDGDLRAIGSIKGQSSRVIETHQNMRKYITVFIDQLLVNLLLGIHLLNHKSTLINGHSASVNPKTSSTFWNKFSFKLLNRIDITVM